MRHIGISIFTAVVCVSTSWAQDSLEPDYGAVSLSSGFAPDPLSVDIQAGGAVDAATLPGCSGYIGRAPDFRVNYSAGPFPLFLSATSAADTTLVVNAPDGAWHCDNDSGGGHDPRVSFARPTTGQYDIWIGVAGTPQSQAISRLSISETQPR